MMLKHFLRPLKTFFENSRDIAIFKIAGNLPLLIVLFKTSQIYAEKISAKCWYSLKF